MSSVLIKVPNAADQKTITEPNAEDQKATTVPNAAAQKATTSGDAPVLCPYRHLCIEYVGKSPYAGVNGPSNVASASSLSDSFRCDICQKTWVVAATTRLFHCPTCKNFDSCEGCSKLSPGQQYFTLEHLPFAGFLSEPNTYEEYVSRLTQRFPFLQANILSKEQVEKEMAFLHLHSLLETSSFPVRWTQNALEGMQRGLADLYTIHIRPGGQDRFGLGDCTVM
jgi:hypothetical protein